MGGPAIDVSRLGLTVQCIPELAGLLRLSPQLETLHVDGNAIGGEGVTILAATMKEHQCLTSLAQALLS
jgi:hypothetical protein